MNFLFKIVNDEEEVVLPNNGLLSAETYTTYISNTKPPRSTYQSGPQVTITCPASVSESLLSALYNTLQDDPASIVSISVVDEENNVNEPIINSQEMFEASYRIESNNGNIVKTLNLFF